MGAISSPRDYEILLPEKRATDTLAFRGAGPKCEWFSNGLFSDEQPPYGERGWHLVTYFLVTQFLIVFFVGAVATLAWQSYGRAAREIVAGSFPQLRWLAPQTAVAETAPDRLDQITRSIDRIAGDIATTQEQITHSIDHLTAGQQQMTREIIRLQAISQYVPSKKAESPLHSASGPARKAGQRSAQER
jgi:hypothetical protein